MPSPAGFPKKLTYFNRFQLILFACSFYPFAPKKLYFMHDDKRTEGKAR
jgi:hypothetical protein